MARSRWPKPLSRRFLAHKARTEEGYAQIDPWVQWLMHQRNWKGRLGWRLLPKLLLLQALWQASQAEQAEKVSTLVLAGVFLPFAQSLARHPLDIWCVCKRRIGTLHIEPWRQKIVAAAEVVRAAFWRGLDWFTPPVRWALGVCLFACYVYILTHPVGRGEALMNAPQTNVGVSMAALASTSIFEVETGGSDTANGGIFDPGQTAGMFTDGAATVANTSAPVFTSASYNFVAGDVGAWVFIGAGTNWTKGWYKISSVAANAATLNGTIGSAVQSSGAITSPVIPSTVIGCATTASPTGATWSIDYSQQAAAQITYTDLASVGAGLLVSSVANPFGKQQVGNALVITGGTNFTTGRYVIASVSAGLVATVVGPGNITTGAGVSGTGGLGGALASLGIVGGVIVTSNQCFIKTGTYTVTSASTNVAAGCYSSSATGVMVQGYDTVRGDLLPSAASGTRPTIIAGTISTFTLIVLGTGNHLIGVILDGNNQTSSRGVSAGSAGQYVGCHGRNCTNSAFVGSAEAVRCSATGCATQSAFNMSFGYLFACVAYSNTVTGFVGGGTYDRCIAYSNSGASSDGFSLSGSFASASSCVSYGNGRDGFRATAAASALHNCVAEGNTGVGYTLSSTAQMVAQSASFNNTGGATSLSGVHAFSLGLVALTATPFTNAASGDFSLNTTAGGGALLRAAGYPGAFPGGLTTGYLDVGAVQHANPAALIAAPIFQSPIVRVLDEVNA